MTALILSGLPPDVFLFAGFLPPRQAARRRAFARWAALDATLVFYEGAVAPRRDPRRHGRDFRRPRGRGRARADQAARGGPPRRASPTSPRTIATAESRAARWSSSSARPSAPRRTRPRSKRRLRAALAELGVRDAAAKLAAETGLPRSQLYRRALALAGLPAMRRQQARPRPAPAARAAPRTAGGMAVLLASAAARLAHPRAQLALPCGRNRHPRPARPRARHHRGQIARRARRRRGGAGTAAAPPHRPRRAGLSARASRSRRARPAIRLMLVAPAGCRGIGRMRGAPIGDPCASAHAGNNLLSRPAIRRISWVEHGIRPADCGSLLRRRPARDWKPRRSIRQ